MKTIMCGSALLCGLLLGCAPDNTGNAYEVRIDPTFTPEQIELIQESTLRWETAVTEVAGPGALSLHVVISGEECQTGNSVDDHTICIHKTTREYNMNVLHQAIHNLGVTMKTDRWDSSNIYIAVDALTYKPNADGTPPATDPVHFRQTLEHEEGHAMGLSHTDKGTLMYAYQGGAAKEVTCADVGQYMDHRHMGFGDCSTLTK